MAKVDFQFLRDVQAAGWVIQSADEDAVSVLCPRMGCALRVKLRSGGAIPQTCRGGRDIRELEVNSFDDARVWLRERRETLGLTIKDVEECAGLTVDYLAKFEKDDPMKTPNAITFIEWAASLGFQVVLRPIDLPPVTVRRIEQTRAQAHDRAKRFAKEQDRRSRGRR